MSAPKPPLSPVKNRLLAALPRAEYERLLPDLEAVHLEKGIVLYEAGDSVRYCYFPTSGMISLLSVTEEGQTVEVSMVGNEGIAGVPAILRASKTPYRVMVQIVADAVRIKAEALRRAFNRGEALQDLLLRYTHALLCQTAQSAVCNQFHTVEERLCRWLLISCDRVHSDSFPLTQEFISQMLGIPRTNVTMTAGALQRENLIRYTRGQITIIDKPGLEATSCECYRIVNEEISGFLAA